MVALEVVLFGSLEEHVRAVDIRADKGIGVENGAIDMGLGCKIDEGVDLVLAHRLLDGRHVADITAHEPEARITNIAEVIEIACIGELVVYDNATSRITLEQIVD